MAGETSKCGMLFTYFPKRGQSIAFGGKEITTKMLHDYWCTTIEFTAQLLYDY